VHLELSGPDRPGIVRLLSTHLAERGVSIEDLHTEVTGAPPGHVFRMQAQLVVPLALTDAELKRVLEALASEMMVDIALDERPARGR
jgi:glycine cleavage system regulatory protein